MNKMSALAILSKYILVLSKVKGLTLDHGHWHDVLNDMCIVCNSQRR